MKIKKGNIALCKALIPNRYCERDLALLQFGKGWLESKKCSAQSIDESVASAQESSVGNLLKKRGGVAVSKSRALLSSVSPFSSLAETEPLRELAVACVFQAWVEDWEEEALKKNDCVSEAQLLAKYKVFRDPNSEKSFLIWKQNMESCRGRGNGWFLIAVWADDEDETDAFSLEIVYELIGET